MRPNFLSRMRRLGVFVAGATTFFAAASCRDERLVLVRVCGELRTPDDIDAIRVSLRDANLIERNGIVLQLTEVRDDAAVPVHQLPVDIRLPIASGVAFVSTTGLKDGIEVIRYDRRVSNPNAGDTYHSALTTACMFVTCSRGQTCVNGECVFSPEDFTPATCTSTAPPDAGIPSDAAPADTGTNG